ncbi:holo-(acyl-carrier-protein) synthase [Sphaeroforma arctica JP610]|uniref:Holo-(Acyl-carrier-protein) synthase n=1 Tax=Sphaeroforma arctica JP610 TaxID=667725 RepID=A0A0L0GA78_9EUKA|nr:holo-(acyl-carrier-protein) synthase [Sphaeroforma arctica JP610]KNC85786.1 holo-(acyl-carrier-protein) synthase [Sphaeroforma arctica JP610]|eukprot:XP_014159688.1 holo-(acyl-carrier-protein) synthase [Sphaeroforma arctica JP610]
MGIKGLGVDLVQVSRIRNAIRRSGNRFLEKVYVSSEIDEYNKRKLASESSAHQYLASRWAVKEAVYKAVNPHVISWRDTSVRKNANGLPEIQPSVHLRQILNTVGVNRIFLSISHDGDYAMAQVILEA